MSQRLSLTFVSTRRVAVLAVALSPVGSLLGCAGGNGDELLRPDILTPTTRQPQDVLPLTEMPVMMGPPPTPVGVPDENGYISGPPQECNGPNVTMGIPGTPAPTTGLLLDFSRYTMPAGTWGDTSVGEITGGTSLYQGAPEAALTQSPGSGKLHIQATIAAGGYTGIVFWFSPCVNASAFSGVQFTATGI
jgi:hypothetical protein